MSILGLSLSDDSTSALGFNVTYTTSKLDSASLSSFQKIGMAYECAGLIKLTRSDNPYASQAYFFATLLDTGLSKCQIEKLLGAEKWNVRMQLAWEMLRAEEREVAKTIDYDEFHNHWRRFDFIKNDYLLPEELSL